MRRFKRAVPPLLFILLTSLLAGSLLFRVVSAPNAGGEPGQGATPLPGADPPGVDGGETLAYKNETVYVVLDPEGRVVDQRIVNRIYRCNGEAEQIKDYGSYLSINNMTSEATPVIRDNVILWDRALLQEGDIYYEGITDKNLPVDFQIDYFLDGDEIEASALAGKSGKLRIVIKMKNNLRAGGTVAYSNYHGVSVQREDTNYIPLLVQGTYTADLNKFSEIQATDGAGIITGQSINVSFMAFPYPEAEIVLTMQGEEIELSQIMMMIIPQLPPIPDVDMEDDLRKMLDGITAIEEGLNALYEGADRIYQGLDLFRNKTNELLSEIEPLLSLIEEWPGFDSADRPGEDDIRSRLEQVLQYLVGLGEMEAQPDFPGGRPDIPDGWPELPDDWPDIPGDWPELPGGQPDREELISYLESIKELLDEYDNLDSYLSGAEEAFEQIGALPEALDQLADGQKQIRDGLGEINRRGIGELKKGLIDGINESRFGKAKIELMRSLADGYRSHADNRNNRASSVQFVLQTEAAGQQNRDDPNPGGKSNGQDPPEKAWYVDLWSRFLDLFSWGA